MKHSIIKAVAGLEDTAKSTVRYAIVIVLLWIGGLKFFNYEADGITPFVANSPFMSFFYNAPQEYAQHINKEGEYVAENRQWHRNNNTYGFSAGLGVFLIGAGILIALHRKAPLLSMAGSMLVFLMTLGTLSFLLTTPESWVSNLGDSDYGFPFLSARGRLVVKDLVILGGTLITMSQSAQYYLKQNKSVIN
ncbi:DUF417 family protein [Flavobacterium beibuense]|uniref:Inner membrane protein YkgB n=1 Tax=Flavobacterium beibuense TaxID=657326 RepID=A0A444WEE3_9FLAO|nr:DUF417 family protein [Flavobacterium beibuense]RYJ44223.1 Inner membrane protein YkgB [Flavobacterium beibuense]